MRDTFLITIKTMLREPPVFFWALIFPLILSSLFAPMLGNVDKAYAFEPIKVAVVADDAYDASPFKIVMDTVGAEGDDQLLDITEVDTAAEANQMLEEEDGIVAYYSVDSNGDPRVFISQTYANSGSVAPQVNCMICKNLADTYLHEKSAVIKLAEGGYMISPDMIEGMFNVTDFTTDVMVTANKSNEIVRYFYALLGFTTLMVCNVSLVAMVRCLPGTSNVGARRTVGAERRSTTLMATLLASWVVSYALLLVVFVYLRFVLGVEFGGRDGYCLLGLAVAALMATSLGTVIGSLPKVSEGAKGGIVAGLTCFLSLFAGVYGEPAMALADLVDTSYPLLGFFNPLKQAANLFYDLYYYTSLEPYAQTCLVLIAFTAVFVLISLLFIRRQRYASV